MNDIVTASSFAQRLAGTEHWTTKEGNVKLFLWNKCAGDPANTKGIVLFVHGSSMASQPTFDLDVPGRPDSSVMEYFAHQGYDTWCVDMEGYGRSEKGRDNNAPISFGADDCFAAATYIQKLRGKRPFLVYGISSGALRAALFAQRHPEMVARLALDAMVWTGEGARRWPSAARGCPNSSPRTAGRSTAPSCTRSSTATIPAPPTSAVIEAFADQILKLDDSVPTGTYVDMCSKLPVVDPEKITVPTLIMRGQWDGIASFEDLSGVLRQAAQPGQAVHRDGRHLARELPAEELHDGLPHPA